MPTTGCQLESQSIALHKQGCTDAALSLLGKAVVKHPNQGSLWLVRAIIRHSQAQWVCALADAETAMTLMPLPIGGQLVLADCYAHLGHSDLALLGYRHLLSQETLPADIYAGLYAGFRRCDRNDLAIKACRAAVASDPENHAAYFGMAHCMAAANYSAAFIASVLSKAVTLDPTSNAYRTSLVIQLVRAGRPDEAYEELVEVAPGSLSSVACLCSARKLMQLCVWANDTQRASALGLVIRQLSDSRSGPKNAGEEQ